MQFLILKNSPIFNFQISNKKGTWTDDCLFQSDFILQSDANNMMHI